LGETLHIVLQVLTEEPSRMSELGDEAIAACFELRAIQLLVARESAQGPLLSSIEDELTAILSLDSRNARKAGGVLIGCLLLALDELPAITDRVLAFLGSLTGRREGTTTKDIDIPPIRLSAETVLDLSKLLDYALFGEVFAFLAGIKHLQRVSALAGLDDFSASVIAIASRKGGVGKSTLALAIALALLRRGDGTRLCIVDLDITGPIWEYVLCPDGRTVDGQPIPYLNKLLTIDQPDDAFDFGSPTADSVLECVARVQIPSVAHDIGLLTFADLPRTNRYIVQAIANNRESFTDFLVAVLRGLSQQYDHIIIDNTPGLDPHPLIALVVAGTVPHGLPVVLSTPHAPDLRGTFLELSDLRFLRFKKRPLWVVNKASEDVESFFSEERTLIDIAAKTRGYAAIMPEAPLLKQMLTPRQLARIVRPLPFDPDLARPNVVDFANPLTDAAIKRFLEGKLFRRFEHDINALLPRSRPGRGSGC
jgi:Mrp family chromosome partitioning ATPase